MTASLTIEYLPALPAQNQINFNFEALEKELIENLEKYQDLIVSEDAISLAKTDKANLNKFRAALEEERKLVKNRCLEPYNIYAEKIKILTDLVDKPILKISAQINSFEEKQKTDKKAEIEKFFSENIGDLKEVILFEKLFKSEYLNKSTSMKSIKEEITQNINTIRGDLKLIEGFNSGFEFELRDTYLLSLNMSTVLSKKQRLEELEAEKIRRAQPVKVVQTLEETEKQVVTQVVEKAKTIERVCRPEMKEISLKVYVNKSQCEALNGFLASQNIKFEQI